MPLDFYVVEYKQENDLANNVKLMRKLSDAPYEEKQTLNNLNIKNKNKKSKWRSPIKAFINDN